MEVPEETSKKNARWRDRPAVVLKYVDDNFQLNKVNMETAMRGDDGLKYRDKHGLACQNVYRRTVRRAEERGMRVNANKTACLLYTSPSPRDS